MGAPAYTYPYSPPTPYHHSVQTATQYPAQCQNGWYEGSESGGVHGNVVQNGESGSYGATSAVGNESYRATPVENNTATASTGIHHHTRPHHHHHGSALPSSYYPHSPSISPPSHTNNSAHHQTTDQRHPTPDTSCASTSNVRTDTTAYDAYIKHADMTLTLPSFADLTDAVVEMGVAPVGVSGGSKEGAAVGNGGECNLGVRNQCDGDVGKAGEDSMSDVDEGRYGLTDGMHISASTQSNDDGPPVYAAAQASGGTASQADVNQYNGEAQSRGWVVPSSSGSSSSSASVHSHSHPQTDNYGYSGHPNASAPRNHGPASTITNVIDCNAFVNGVVTTSMSSECTPDSTTFAVPAPAQSVASQYPVYRPTQGFAVAGPASALHPTLRPPRQNQYQSWAAAATTALTFSTPTRIHKPPTPTSSNYLYSNPSCQSALNYASYPPQFQSYTKTNRYTDPYAYATAQYQHQSHTHKQYSYAYPTPPYRSPQSQLLAFNNGGGGNGGAGNGGGVTYAPTNMTMGDAWGVVSAGKYAGQQHRRRKSGHEKGRKGWEVGMGELGVAGVVEVGGGGGGGGGQAPTTTTGNGHRYPGQMYYTSDTTHNGAVESHTSSSSSSSNLTNIAPLALSTNRPPKRERSDTNTHNTSPFKKQKPNPIAGGYTDLLNAPLPAVDPGSSSSAVDTLKKEKKQKEKEKEKEKRAHHPGPKRVKPPPQPVSCGECGKVLSRPFNLKVHMKTHDPKRERPFVCPICTKTFVRQHDLVRHQATHSSFRNFFCEGCGKAFVRKDALDRHLRVNGRCKSGKGDVRVAGKKEEDEGKGKARGEESGSESE
ncbi:hypothetical protein HDV00_001367 [Rhizophlyctis rosea]|nr:hypothetical protein HDV00_001367 [Rhizophlyctis rosea]